MDLNRLPAKLNCTRQETPPGLNNSTAKVNNDVFTEKGNLDIVVQKVIENLIVAVTESVQNNHERQQHVDLGDSQLFTHHKFTYQSESTIQVETDSANELAMVSNSCNRDDVTDLVDQLIVAICELNNREREHSDQGYFERLKINEVNLKHLTNVGNRSNTNQHVDSDEFTQLKSESKHSSNGEMQCLMVGCSNSGYVPSSATIQQAKSNDLSLPKINLVNTQRATNNLDVPDDVLNLVGHLITVISRLQNNHECQTRQQADSQISKNQNGNIDQLTNANDGLDKNYQASFNILNPLTTTLVNEAVVTHNSSNLDEIKNLLASLTNAVNEQNSDCEFQHCDPLDSKKMTIPSADLDQLPSTVNWPNINCPSTQHSFTTLVNESLINANPCVLDEVNIQADYFNVVELTLSSNSDCKHTELCDYQDSCSQCKGCKEETIPVEVSEDAQALCPVEPNVTNNKKDCCVSVMPQNSWQIDNMLTYLGGSSFPTCHIDSRDPILNDSLQNTLAEVSISEDETLQELTPMLSFVEDSLEEIVEDSQSQQTVSTHTSECYEDFESIGGNISFDRHESVIIQKTLISEVTIDQILPQFQCDEDDESLPELLIEDNNFDLGDELDVCEIMEHFYYNETLASGSQFSADVPQDATPSLVSQSSLQSKGDSEWFSCTQPFQTLPDCEDVTFSPVVGFGCTQPFRPTLNEDSSDLGRSCCSQSCTSLNGIGYLEVDAKYIHRGTSPIPTEAMFGRDVEVKPVSDFNQRHPTANLCETNDDQHVPNIKEPPPSGQSHICEHSNLVPDIENMENSLDTNSDPYLYSCKGMPEDSIPTLPLLPGTQRPLRIGLSRREHVRPLHQGFSHARK